MSKDVLDQISVHDARGVITDLMEKLGGPHGHEWLVATKKYLRTPRAWKFPIWKTITLGEGNTKGGVSGKVGSVDTDAFFYRQHLEVNGHSFHQNAGNGCLLESYAIEPQISAVEKDVDLVLLKATDLGLKPEAEYQEVCDRAVEVGLELCPLEVGPALRLVFKQRIGGMIIVAAKEPIEVNGPPLTFVLGRPRRDQSDLVSVAVWRLTGEHFGKEIEFVFIRPRP